MLDKIFPIIVGLIALMIVALFVLVLFVPDGQKWFTDMMISSTVLCPDCIPTLSYSDQGFLFKCLELT